MKITHYTDRLYTDEQMIELFPRQAKTEEDIFWLKMAFNYTPYRQHMVEASQYEQVKTGYCIKALSTAMSLYSKNCIEQAIQSNRAVDGVWISAIAELYHRTSSHEYYTSLIPYVLACDKTPQTYCLFHVLCALILSKELGLQAIKDPTTFDGLSIRTKTENLYYATKTN